MTTAKDLASDLRNELSEWRSALGNLSDRAMSLDEVIDNIDGLDALPTEFTGTVSNYRFSQENGDPMPKHRFELEVEGWLRLAITVPSAIMDEFIAHGDWGDEGWKEEEFGGQTITVRKSDDGTTLYPTATGGAPSGKFVLDTNGNELRVGDRLSDGRVIAAVYEADERQPNGDQFDFQTLALEGEGGTKVANNLTKKGTEPLGQDSNGTDVFVGDLIAPNTTGVTFESKQDATDGGYAYREVERAEQSGSRVVVYATNGGSYYLDQSVKVPS